MVLPPSASISHPEHLKFDPAILQPPPWASDHQQRFADIRAGKLGQSSSSYPPPRSVLQDDASDCSAEGSDQNDIFEDAVESQENVDAETARFTTSALQDFLSRATDKKDEGNKAFVSKPPDVESAMRAYRSAIDILPNMPFKQRISEKASGKAPARSGVEEITEDEAAELKAASSTSPDPAKEEADERERIEDAIRQCQKASWGNLAACHVSLKEDKEAVEACTKALDIDPDYVKALSRRAAANERISSWTSLTACQSDNDRLLQLLPHSSLDAIRIRKVQQALPTRIKMQQQKETDEMLGKLKDLGNGLLGKFGLSTDMFKFHEQPGGGYSMSFDQGSGKS